jgi:hypothetical protein
VVPTCHAATQLLALLNCFCQQPIAGVENLAAAICRPSQPPKILINREYRNIYRQ